ncbi:hypothetical protein SAMN04490243_1856 [Robiginitalea myxolifaciens]|uniref:HEAT repeat-containing protein n=1 Tax=Robiginitalea myxolifaciens TaxID=400055 RepID=A0A1I6GX66_9FLAO|nr:HEAT repeat domain-containing protein [Robiginitalea myxolifaciens]SFR46853.1 hypothetical protein SAMN04490243_1856 [Robiginitalea myxolifaciens]
MSINWLTYLPVSFIDPPKIHTSLVWDLAILFAVLSGVYFLVIFLLRSRIIRRNKTIRELKLEIAPMISNFLFFEQDTNREEREEYITMKLDIRERLKDPASRMVMTQVLLDLRKDVSGDARDRVFALYQDLGLDRDAFAKLKSWRWERVSQGILDLTEMRVDRAYPYIRKFINDRRSVIRKQAQLASVTLRAEGITYFLDTAKYRISEWQQLKLLELLQRREAFDPPRFKAWLTSENSDVVLFALRLIRHYRQTDAEAGLIALLKHRNSEIKNASLECIRDFCFSSAKPALKEVFRHSGEESRILILDALAQVGEDSDMEFVSGIAAKDKSFIVRSKAKSVMNSIAPDSALPEFARIDTEQAVEEKLPEEVVESETEPVAKRESEMVAESETEAIAEKETQSYGEELLEIEVSEPIDLQATTETEETNLLAEEPDAEEEVHPTVFDLDELLARADHEFTDEELEIFDVCLWEELDDILSDLEPQPNLQYLPLDFLPIVQDTAVAPAATSKAVQAKDWIDLNFLPEVVSEKEEVRLTEPVEDELLDIQFTPELEARENAGEPSEPSADPYSKDPEDTGVNALPEDAENSLLAYFEWDSEILPPENKEAIAPEDLKDLEVAYELERTEEDTPGISIFQEYFEQYDTESQLILLEEIPGVGGTKELHLLQKLSKTAPEPVRSKATKALDKLSKRLNASAQKSNSDSQ